MDSSTTPLSLLGWQQILESLVGSPLSTKDIVDLAKQYKPLCMKLWEGFTGHRSLSSSYMSEKDFAVAYLLGFHIANAQRTELLFSRLWNQRGFELPSNLPLHLWDMGSGTGSVVISCLEFFRSKGLTVQEIALNDLSSLTVNTTQKVLENLAHLPVSSHISSGLDFLPLADTLSRDVVHIFSFGYVFNELPESLWEALAARFWDWSCQGVKALVTILDSADEVLSRDLLLFRNSLTEMSPALVPLYPCPHSLSCPMTETRDRCYSEGSLSLPTIQKKIDSVTGHPRRLMAMSGYGFATPSLFAIMKKPERLHKVLVGIPQDRVHPDLHIPLYCLPSGKLRRDTRHKSSHINDSRGEMVFRRS